MSLFPQSVFAVSDLLSAEMRATIWAFVMPPGEGALTVVSKHLRRSAGRGGSFLATPEGPHPLSIRSVKALDITARE